MVEGHSTRIFLSAFARIEVIYLVIVGLYFLTLMMQTSARDHKRYYDNDAGDKMDYTNYRGRAGLLEEGRKVSPDTKNYGRMRNNVEIAITDGTTSNKVHSNSAEAVDEYAAYDDVYTDDNFDAGNFSYMSPFPGAIGYDPGKPLPKRQPTPEEIERYDNLSTALNQHLKKEGRDPINKNCSSCVLREQARLLRIESIKNQILTGLKLKKPPNITGKVLPRAPSFQEYLKSYSKPASAPYREAKRYDDDDDDESDDATTSRVFLVANKAPIHLRLGDNVNYFAFDHNVMGYNVVRATFYVYVKPINGTVSPITIRLFHINAPTRPGEQPVKGHRVRTKRVHLRPDISGRWIKMDVRRSVQQWINNPNDNYGLLLTATDRNDREASQSWVNFQTGSPENEYAPTLDVSLHPYQSRAKREMVGLKCHESESSEARCCKYPLTVDFESFGWDFIQVPKSYRADFCSGKCPLRFLNDYYHTFLVQIAVPQGATCCTARQLKELSLLYLTDEGNLYVSNVPNMIVMRCGCA